MKPIRLIVLALLVLTVSSVTFAQEDESPLLDLLDLLPQGSSGDLYYNDFAAIERAYPDARRPADWDEFNAFYSARDYSNTPLAVWWKVFSLMQTPLLRTSMSNYGDLPESLGIDVFEIDRVVVSGLPPNVVTIVEGDFDMDAVRAAHTRRGYSVQESDGTVELWCGAVGCENSSRTNAREADPANLFGGDLGRQWGMLFLPGRMIGANQFSDLQAVQQAVTDDTQTLTADPFVRAAALGVSGKGTLLQAQFVFGGQLYSFYLPPISPRFTPAQRPAAIRALLDAGYETLPVFDLLMLADLVNDTHQIGALLLVYQTEADAEQAAAILPARIESYASFFYRRPLLDLWAGYLVDTVEVDVVPVEDQFVVRVMLTTPRATAEQIVAGLTPSLDMPDVTQPGTLYRSLMQAYFAQDLGWLSTYPREELDALAGN